VRNNNRDFSEIFKNISLKKNYQKTLYASNITYYPRPRDDGLVKGWPGQRESQVQMSQCHFTSSKWHLTSLELSSKSVVNDTTHYTSPHRGTTLEHNESYRQGNTTRELGEPMYGAFDELFHRNTN
ncbi:hypothetical protein BgiBS90_008085, partial [Biomphalaria glabrata]